jgi:hypothetical protein
MDSDGTHPKKVQILACLTACLPGDKTLYTLVFGISQWGQSPKKRTPHF